MSLNEFLDQAWKDHVSNSGAVAERLEAGIGLIEKNDQIPALAQLIHHVMGEHLGQRGKGVELLARLRGLPIFEANSEAAHALRRLVASLEVASGDSRQLETFSRSDEIRVLTMAASALSGQGETTKALELFRSSLTKAMPELSKEDPANKALAIAGNNLAVALEELPSRSPLQTELMILAAETARRYWQVVGTWLEVERAEYRLAQTLLRAGDSTRALEHAELCLRICRENNAPSLELFFAYEVATLVHRSLGHRDEQQKALLFAKESFEKLSEEDKGWCGLSLQKLENG